VVPVSVATLEEFNAPRSLERKRRQTMVYILLIAAGVSLVAGMWAFWKGVKFMRCEREHLLEAEALLRKARSLLGS
jgi:hypothetical protein